MRLIQESAMDPVLAAEMQTARPVHAQDTDVDMRLIYSGPAWPVANESILDTFEFDKETLQKFMKGRILGFHVGMTILPCFWCITLPTLPCRLPIIKGASESARIATDTTHLGVTKDEVVFRCQGYDVCMRMTEQQEHRIAFEKITSIYRTGNAKGETTQISIHHRGGNPLMIAGLTETDHKRFYKYVKSRRKELKK